MASDLTLEKLILAEAAKGKLLSPSRLRSFELPPWPRHGWKSTRLQTDIRTGPLGGARWHRLKGQLQGIRKVSSCP